jgi:predicted ATP-grasp superfamily ATP-dependent carboligase
MEILKIPALRTPVMVVAFTGWNDAGEAASEALAHLLGAWSGDTTSMIPELIAEIDPEEFYDFQVNRPIIDLDESQIRSITWPTTRVFGIQTPHLENDFVIVQGAEPSMRWKYFTREILDLADDLDVSLVITLGSLLADAPHTRSISVSGTGGHPDLAKRLGVETSRYEGPTGILGIIQENCFKRGIDAISLWAAVPHYASQSPSPKASLALINALEDFLEIDLPLGELPTESIAWEAAVDSMAKEDSDIAEYIKSLEESKDASEIPEASGESIAKEFERYLRRQKD